MFSNRYLNDVDSNATENHPMFLQCLSSIGPSSCFLPRIPPALIRTTLSTSASSFVPAPPPPHPWWSAWSVPQPPPPQHPLLPFRTLRNTSSGWRSFSSSSVDLLMERDREPPPKRTKKEKAGGGGLVADGTRRGEENVRERQRGGGGAEGAGRSKQHQTEGRRKDWSPETMSSKPAPWFKERRREEVQQHGGGASASERSISSRSVWSRLQPLPSDQESTVSDQNISSSSVSGRTWSRLQPPPDKSSLMNLQHSETGSNREILQEPTAKMLDRRWESCSACSTQPPPAGVSSSNQPPPAGVSGSNTQVPPAEGNRAAFDFSIMSYNILSQRLLQDNSHLYRHCPLEVLQWKHRFPNLLAEIQLHDADILCLQEVQEDHYHRQIKPALQMLGYQCKYKKRTGSKPDGCAVAFKPSRLTLVSSKPVEFFRHGDALLDRDNVALVLKLRPHCAADSASSTICVANTHLLYNPRRGDIKLAQLAILLAEIDRMVQQPDGTTAPVLLCGDLNSTPWCPLYSFLTTGALDYRGLQIGMVSGQEVVSRAQRLLSCPIWTHSLGVDHRCRFQNQDKNQVQDQSPVESSSSSSGSAAAAEGAVSQPTVEELGNDVMKSAAAVFNRSRIEHGLKLRSSYPHLLMHDGKPEITTCHSKTALTVDYILYTPDSAPPPPAPGGRGLQLLARLALVGQSALQEVDGLPSHHHSSDHLPLIARFRLRL